MNFKVLTKMFKLRKKMFSVPSADFGNAARDPQGVIPLQAGDVGAPLTIESEYLHSARGT